MAESIEVDHKLEQEMTLSLLCDKSAVPITANNIEMNLLCKLTAADDEDSRAPVSVCTVIDRSYSMLDNIVLMKDTLKFMVDQFQHNDRLSLITFDQEAKVEFGLTLMDDAGKARAKNLIDKLEVGGHTNLSGGLLAGLDILHKIPAEMATAVESVLLFTDGKTNFGITIEKSIVRATKNTVAQIGRNVSVFTFGYGLEHDANMLTKIAEAGNGLFYYIENPESIPESFCDCMGGLLSVAAQNIELTLQANPNVVLSPPLTTYDVRTISENNHYVIKIRDIYAGESKCIIVPCKFTNQPVTTDQPIIDTLCLARLDIKCYSIVSGRRIELKCEISVKIDPNINKSLLSPYNKEILVHYIRTTTAGVLDRAREMADRKNINESRILLKNKIAEIKVSAAANEDICLYCIETLEETLASLKDVVAYESKGNKLMNQYAQCHYQQRNNDTYSSPSYTSIANYTYTDVCKPNAASIISNFSTKSYSSPQRSPYVCLGSDKMKSKHSSKSK